MLYRIDYKFVVYNNAKLEQLDFYRINDDGAFEPVALVEYMYSTNPDIHYYNNATEKEKEMVKEYLYEIEPDFFD